MTRVWLALCALEIAVPAGAQNPSEILQRAGARVIEMLDRMPNYVCTETIDRLRYERRKRGSTEPCGRSTPEGGKGPAPQLASSDRLRLEVAATATGEMYSWPGANRFAEQGLFDLVGGRKALSTGNFSGIPEAVFVTDQAALSYAGTAAHGERSLAEFRFRVPQEQSHWVFGREHSSPIGYEGSVFIDPRTADLVRLVLRSAEVPAETGACEVTTALEYGPVRLNGADYLLPRGATLRLSYQGGEEDENRIQYAGCREFLGTSSIQFGVPAPPPAPVAAPQSTEPDPLALPQNAEFTVVFPDDLDTAKAAAGDPIRGRLETAMADRQSGTRFPKGTTVLGRIVRFERFYPRQRDPVLTLVVRMESVELPGQSVPLSATNTPQETRFRRSGRGEIYFHGFTFGPVEGLSLPDSAMMLFQYAGDGHVIRGGFKVTLVAAGGPFSFGQSK